MTSTETPLRVHPDRPTFERLASEWPLVPVWAELLADIGTPIGLFPAVAGDGPGLLLESVERSERWGRFSFAPCRSTSPRGGCRPARRCGRSPGACERRASTASRRSPAG
jgi:hypothetical protein